MNKQKGYGMNALKNAEGFFIRFDSMEEFQALTQAMMRSGYLRLGFPGMPDIEITIKGIGSHE